VVPNLRYKDIAVTCGDYAAACLDVRGLPVSKPKHLTRVWDSFCDHVCDKVNWMRSSKTLFGEPKKVMDYLIDVGALELEGKCCSPPQLCVPGTFALFAHAHPCSMHHAQFLQRPRGLVPVARAARGSPCLLLHALL
jgi:hypothetical protein